MISPNFIIKKEDEPNVFVNLDDIINPRHIVIWRGDYLHL